MNFDFLVNLFSAALQTAGESKLVEILQDLHDSNKDDYDAAIHGGYALVKHLKPLTDKSKTKIDNAIVDALLDAIQTSANENDVVLEEATT